VAHENRQRRLRDRDHNKLGALLVELRNYYCRHVGSCPPDKDAGGRLNSEINRVRRLVYAVYEPHMRRRRH